MDRISVARVGSKIIDKLTHCIEHTDKITIEYGASSRVEGMVLAYEDAIWWVNKILMEELSTIKEE